MSAPAPPSPAPTAELTRALGHDFARPELLREALTHPSALPTRGRRRDRPPHNYERLEFLGDRVLGLVIAELLWRRFAAEPEGDLTRRLTHLVRREALARVAETIGLGHYLILSPAEAAAGQAAENPAILANVCEAVIAAVHLDGGFDAAARLVRRLWEPLLEGMTGPPRDPKTELQEWAQARGLALPSYVLVETSGPDHAPRFTVAARVKGFEPATGTASSKRQAETRAAARLLEALAAAG